MRLNVFCCFFFFFLQQIVFDVKAKKQRKKAKQKKQKKNKCIAVLGVCFHIKSEAAVNVSPGCVQDPLEPSPWFRSTFDCFPTVLVHRLKCSFYVQVLNWHPSVATVIF